MLLVGPSFYVCSPPSGAVSRTETASGGQEAVLRAFEDASRTREGCF